MTQPRFALGEPALMPPVSAAVHEVGSEADPFEQELQVTAACYSKPMLHIVTLKRLRSGTLKLIDDRCASCAFDEREAAATSALHAKLSCILDHFACDRLVLRTTRMRGTYVAHPLAFKVEALLDLHLGAGLQLAHSHNIAKWAGKREYDLPAPQDLDFGAEWADGQIRAIEAAAYVLAGGLLAD